MWWIPPYIVARITTAVQFKRNSTGFGAPRRIAGRGSDSASQPAQQTLLLTAADRLRQKEARMKGLRKSTPSELRWSLLKDLERIECRVRGHGETGWEVQLVRADGFRCVRHVRSHSQAMDFADALRCDLEREGWAAPQWPQNVRRFDTRYGSIAAQQRALER